jgi:cell pole-organizing protein PopZ
MSSGTQIDLDWSGVNAALSDAATPPPSGATGASTGAGTYLTDEEILGIDPPSPKGGHGGQGLDHAGNTSARNAGSGAPTVGARHAVPLPTTPQGQTPGATAQVMPEWMLAATGDPKHGAEVQKLWQEHQAFRASFSSPDEARAIKELFPGGAQEAHTLRQAAQAVDQLDAAIYSGDSRAQSEVVAELARANPAAFRQLFAEAAKVLAGMGQVQTVSNQTPTLRETGEGWGTQQSITTSQDPSMASRTSPVTNHESQITNHPSPSVRASQSQQFDPTAYAAFERSTNDTVARDVRVAVSDTLARVMPEGIAEGAARRIGDDIFNEIHRTLASDRSLSEQVGEILRGSAREFSANGWRIGTAEQQRVASLLASRAKQLVPGVARRVIGEWTSSVLGASRSKAARQASAAARVDIAAPGGSLDSMPLRAMSPREVDYASMSDDEILGM